MLAVSRPRLKKAQTSLRHAYELATQKHGGSDDYEEVLWAVADGSIMVRQTSEIYTNSYQRIVGERGRRTEPLTKELFYQENETNLKKDKATVQYYGVARRVGMATTRAWYADTLGCGLKKPESHIGVDHIIR